MFEIGGKKVGLARFWWMTLTAPVRVLRRAQGPTAREVYYVVYSFFLVVALPVALGVAGALHDTGAAPPADRAMELAGRALVFLVLCAIATAIGAVWSLMLPMDLLKERGRWFRVLHCYAPVGLTAVAVARAEEVSPLFTLIQFFMWGLTGVVVSFFLQGKKR